MTEHRLLPILKAVHPKIWKTLSPDSQRTALAMALGQPTDRKTLSRIVKAVQKGETK